MMTKLKFYSLLFLGFCISQNLFAKEFEINDFDNPNNEDRKAYIEKYKYIAMEEMARHRIPASIKLAQGILESADGKSRLASDANNHFGMKCGTKWQGETFYLKDDDYDSNGNLVKSCFRSYEKAEESYYAHSQFLRNPEKEFRYGFLFNLDIKDYRAWAKGLKASGYATNPEYANILIRIIETNRLYQYDELTRMPVNFPDIQLIPSGPIASNNNTPKPPLTNRPAVKNEVVLNNGLRMIFASEGDTPKSMGEFFGISAKKLSRYNEFYEYERMPLADGDRVYLQPKRKAWKGLEKEHVVKASESMYSIAQMYGVKINKLYKRNRMEKGMEPAPGQKIYVRGKRPRSSAVKIRKEGIPTRPSIPKPNDPEIAVLDKNNVADEIKNKVKAFDLNKRIDAYAKITDGTYRPPVTTTHPTTTTHYPTTTTPTRPTPPTRPVATTPLGPDIITYPPTHPTTTPTTPTPPRPTVTYPTTPPPAPPVTQPTPAPPSSPAIYHTVQGGETLYAISKKYSITVGQIKALNNLNSNLISVGQKLRVR